MALPPNLYILRRTALNADAKGLIVTSDLEVQQALVGMLAKFGMAALSASTVGEAEAILTKGHCCIILSSEELSDGAFGDKPWLCKRDTTTIPVIVFSPFVDWNDYLKLLRMGAFDYVQYPAECGEIERVIQRALKFQEEAKSAVY